MNTGHVVFLIGRIRFLAHRRISQELERLGHPGLVPSHGSILNKLYELGPLPMNRLARIIGRRKNTVTTLVRKLEDTDYVRRMPSPQDARVAMIIMGKVPVRQTACTPSFLGLFDSTSRMYPKSIPLEHFTLEVSS